MSDPRPVSGLPVWHPPSFVLDLAELVLSGAVDPALVTRPVLAALATSGLGSSGPAAASGVVLEDAEGTPVAVLDLGGAARATAWSPLRPFAHGPLRTERRSPEEVRRMLALVPDLPDDPDRSEHSDRSRPPARSGRSARSGRGVLGVPVAVVPGVAEVQVVLRRARDRDLDVLWLAVMGDGRRTGLPPAPFCRAVRSLEDDAAAAGVGSLIVPVAVPLIATGTELVSAPDAAPAADTDADRSVDMSLLEAVSRSYGATEVDVAAFRGEGEETPHPAFAAELARIAGRPAGRGLVVFFTGLSGSGKSTVARALTERIETAGRTVSLLDGDEVRRLLSAGLGFSRADRDLNIARIGFVATEVARHGGWAVCAPIAPFAAARDAVRAAVDEVGDFVLVHVSTPLEECERRDRKGLYARARRGEIPDFTGISSPYEVPEDADLRLDTTGTSLDDAVALVLEVLAARGVDVGPEA